MKSLVEITQAKSLEQALRKAIAGFSQKNPEISLKAIEELIKSIKDINAQDENPASLKTAMHVAVIFKTKPIIDLLLAAKARYDIPDATGKTALCYAASSDSEEVKQVMFSALATAATNSIAKEFHYVSKEEREKKENADKLVQKRNMVKGYFEGLNPLVNNFIPALLTVDKGTTRKPSDSEQHRHNAEKEIMQVTMDSLVYLVAMMKSIQSTELNLNYCGLVGGRLCVELYKQKAIYTGKLNVKLLSFSNTEVEHEILLINCQIDSQNKVFITESTILCNPFRIDEAERVLVGKSKVTEYLLSTNMIESMGIADTKQNAESTLLLQTRFVKIPFNNVWPNFDQLLYANKEFAEHILGVQEAALQDIQIKGGKHVLKEYIDEKFCALYAEKEKSRIIEKMQSFPHLAPLAQDLTRVYNSIRKQKAASQLIFQFAGQVKLLNKTLGSGSAVENAAAAGAGAAAAAAGSGAMAKTPMSTVLNPSSKKKKKKKK